MSEDKTSVLFTSGDGDNPYYRLLFDALKNNGVEAIREPIPTFLPLTRAVIRNENIDIIHLDWLYGFFMFRRFSSITILNTIITVGRAVWFCVDLLIIKLLGVQLVWTVHNKYHHERYYLRTERVLNVVVANLVNRLTVKCETAKQTISDIYRVRDDSKIAVIPDGNYMDAYPDELEEEEARSWLDVEEDFIYLYFGKIRPYKGVGKLLRAFQSIDDPEAALWIVGNPQTEKIETNIHSLAEQDDRVRTRLEYIPDDEIQYYMNAANVLVFPYRDILNSGSVYLGLSFGKPIIAPKMGCIPSVIPEENRLIYDDSASNGITSAMLRAKELNLEKISEKNLEKAKNYDWGSIAAMYCKIYNHRHSD